MGTFRNYKYTGPLSYKLDVHVYGVLNLLLDTVGLSHLCWCNFRVIGACELALRIILGGGAWSLSVQNSFTHVVNFEFASWIVHYTNMTPQNNVKQYFILSIQ